MASRRPTAITSPGRRTVQCHRAGYLPAVEGPGTGWERHDQLEAAWRTGSADALRDAYDAYGTLVHSFCVRLVGRDGAADCVQETFISAWRSRARFDPARGSLAGWLLGIARYRSLDHLRSMARVPHPLDPARETATSASDTDDGAHVANRLLVAHALETLSGRPRAVVELAMYSDLTQTQIAERLDVPLGTVKSDMRRAYHRLRVHLEEREVIDGEGG